MKKKNLSKCVVAICLSAFIVVSFSCKKTESPDNTDDSPSAKNPHQMQDTRIVGEWKNVSVSDFTWQNDFGVNGGPQNGSYLDYKINADGSGTCVKYVTTSEPGNTYAVFQRTAGFFKAKPNGGPEGYYEFTYCPTSGILELSKNGVTTKRKLTGNELYRENDPHSARDYFPAYSIVQPSSGSYTDPHHYMYYTYTDKDGNLVNTPNGSPKVTSMVDVL
jgi:hypothetical protein